MVAVKPDQTDGIEEALQAAPAEQPAPGLSAEQVEMELAVKYFVTAVTSAVSAASPAAIQTLRELCDDLTLENRPPLTAGELKRRTHKLYTALAALPPAAVMPKDHELMEVLSELVEHIVTFKGSRHKEAGRAVIDLFQDSLTRGVRRLIDLVGQIKEEVWQEKIKAIKQISGILTTLEGTEQEFIAALSSSRKYLSGTNADFNREVESGIADLASLTEGEGADLDELLKTIGRKVDGLRESIQRKKASDAERLTSLTQEQGEAERRLASFHRDYEEFSLQSREMLREIEALKEISLRDQLTGAYNRRAYDRQVVKTIADYQARVLHTASLVVFDIDHFCVFNNTFGHLAGDRILQSVAGMTIEALRADDFFFRYGGDEFVMLLPNTPLAAAVGVAEKFRRALAHVDFKLAKSSEKIVRVTISAGVAELRPDDDMNSVFARADRALYDAKQAGRNRVHGG